MIKHCGGPAVVRRWSGGGASVVQCADGCRWCTDGGPTVVRRWSGGGCRWWSGGCRWLSGGFRSRFFDRNNGLGDIGNWGSSRRADSDHVDVMVLEVDFLIHVHDGISWTLIALEDALTVTSDRTVCHSIQQTRVRSHPKEITTTSSATQFPIKEFHCFEHEFKSTPFL
ncbi:hypothetical protein LXL04_009093 [Taraxacum kok-saghyz]